MSSHLPKTTRAGILTAVVFLLALAALYEAAVALRVIPMGKVPGEGPFGGGFVLLIALLALLTGVVVTQSCTASRLAEWKSLAPLVAPAAAAFVAARFFAFDDYYLPTLRRMSDGGLVAGWWIVALGVLALLVAVVAKIRPRAGIMTSFLLLAIALTSVAEGIGH